MNQKLSFPVILNSTEQEDSKFSNRYQRALLPRNSLEALAVLQFSRLLFLSTTHVRLRLNYPLVEAFVKGNALMKNSYPL